LWQERLSLPQIIFVIVKWYAKVVYYLEPYPLSQKQEFDLNKLEDLKAEVEELKKRVKSWKRGKTDNNCDVKILNSGEEVIAMMWYLMWMSLLTTLKHLFLLFGFTNNLEMREKLKYERRKYP